MPPRTERNIELEKKVLAAIKEGYNKLYKIGTYTQAPDSELDHALQRLRRNGEIQFDSKKGWTVKEKPNG